jgi:type I restriction enzyme S subunit
MTVADCMAAIIDYRGKSPRKTDSGIPLITAKVVKGGRLLPPDEYIAPEDYHSWMRRGLPEPGDVVMTTEAPLGEVAQLDGRKVALAQRLITLRGHPRLLDNTYLRFVMQSLFVQEQLLARSTGTTVFGIRQSELRKVELPVPPLLEQEAVAGVLGSIEAKITLNDSMNETLDAIARAIFRSWFVDFAPVRAKATGHLPNWLNAATARLFPDHFEDSSLGRIPAEWRVSRIGDEVVTLLGGTPSRDEPRFWKGGTIPWINSGTANEFRVIEPSEYITREGLEGSATKLLPERTTIIAITGATLGQVSLLEIAACANQSIVAVLGCDKIPSEFIYFWIRQNVDDLLSWQTGGAQQHINKNNVNDLPLLCPPDAVVHEYLRIVKPHFDRIRLNCQESLVLTTIRGTLLPALLSGEIRVMDAEKSLGAAT